MESVTFTLEGRIPSKKNSRITLKTGVTIPSKDYTDWQHGARWVVREAWRKAPTEKQVAIRFTSNVRNDIDNLQSSLFDMMEGIVYENDRQIVGVEGTKVPKNGKPYVTCVTVEVLE